MNAPQLTAEEFQLQHPDLYTLAVSRQDMREGLFVLSRFRDPVSADWARREALKSLKYCRVSLIPPRLGFPCRT